MFSKLKKLFTRSNKSDKVTPVTLLWADITQPLLHKGDYTEIFQGVGTDGTNFYGEVKYTEKYLNGTIKIVTVSGGHYVISESRLEFKVNDDV